MASLAQLGHTDLSGQFYGRSNLFFIFARLASSMKIPAIRKHDEP